MKKKGNGARVTIITPTPDHSQHSINYILAPWYFYHFWWCQRNFAKVFAVFGEGILYNVYVMYVLNKHYEQPDTDNNRLWSEYCEISINFVDISNHFSSLQGTINRILPLVIMGSFSCLGGITALFLPETLWRHLPNTLEEGEGFGSMDWRHLLQCPQKRWVGAIRYVLATRRNVWFCSNFEETREAVNKIEIHEAANKTEATSLWETRQHELCYITQQIKWLALRELQVTLIGLSRSIWLHLFQLDVTRPADCFDVF